LLGHNRTLPLKAGPASFKRLLGSRSNEFNPEVLVVQPRELPPSSERLEVRTQTGYCEQQCLNRINAGSPVLPDVGPRPNCPGTIPIFMRRIRHWRRLSYFDDN